MHLTQQNGSLYYLDECAETFLYSYDSREWSNENVFTTLLSKRDFQWKNMKWKRTLVLLHT